MKGPAAGCGAVHELLSAPLSQRLPLAVARHLWSCPRLFAAAARRHEAATALRILPGWRDWRLPGSGALIDLCRAPSYFRLTNWISSSTAGL